MLKTKILTQVCAHVCVCVCVRAGGGGGGGTPNSTVISVKDKQVCFTFFCTYVKIVFYAVPISVSGHLDEH